MRRARVVLAAAAVIALVLGYVVHWRSLTGSSQPESARRGRLDPATGVRPQAANPTGGVEGTRAAWVSRENAKGGSADWRITDTSRRGEIEGYADKVSAVSGETVTLYVSTSAANYVVTAYRMGHYGGLGARQVWQSAQLAGLLQAPGVRDPSTNMVEAPWEPSTRLELTSAWPPGVYLLKLVTDTGGQHYIPLTVRDDASTAAYVVQNSVTTWQAYNLWGGYSLYEGSNGNRSDFQHRSRVVSFDRPYAMGDGSGDFLGNELPLVSLVESLGLDVTYTTNVDLHRRPEVLLKHRALLSLGHDEYWSASMRRGAEAARDRGVNLAFLGANAVFRQIRFADSPIGPDRRVIGFKRAAEDPYYGVKNEEVTVDWRAPPVSDPESSLIGNLYECNPVKADMVITDPDAWVFEGTGLQQGDRLPDMVGPEYDRYDPTAPAPPNVQILAHSPLRCGGRASYSDMTYYSAPSGAGVFSTGTNWWISRLASSCAPAACPHDGRAVRITENLLRAFGAGPAGLAHPSVANYDTLPRVSAPTPPPPRATVPRPRSRAPLPERPPVRRSPPVVVEPEYYEEEYGFALDPERRRRPMGASPAGSTSPRRGRSA